MKHLVAPSVLSADFADLRQDIKMLNNSQADWIHVDIMDGVFVPNISFGFPVLKAIAKHAAKPLDVHLMITDPGRYISQFIEAGASMLTVHYEACTHLHSIIRIIKELGCRAGVSLNPHTPVSVLEDIIGDIDLVLLMSVNPGFGGQEFISQTYAKIHKLKALAAGRNESLYIEIDGGVNMQNSASLLKAGANVLVAGNSIFHAADPQQAIAELKSISADTLNT